MWNGKDCIKRGYGLLGIVVEIEGFIMIAGYRCKHVGTVFMLHFQSMIAHVLQFPRTFIIGGFAPFKFSSNVVVIIVIIINDKLNLGRVNGTRRFTPQMLRSYQASQLAEAGMNDANIDLLQGRKPQSIARKSYIRVKRSKLKEEYIRCLPYLVVEDIEEIRTELDVTKSKLEEKTIEYNNLHESIKSIQEEMNNMKKRQDLWEQLKEDQ